MIGFDIVKAFKPDTPLLEILFRGSVIYISIFIMLRLILKRQSGDISTNDLLVMVLIADAAQNAMAGNYDSITDGLILIATLLFWSYFLDWLGFHSRTFEKFLLPPPLLLIKDGKMLRRNMKKELITEEELFREIRQQGLEGIAQIKKAYMEADGQMSFILENGENGKNQP